MAHREHLSDLEQFLARIPAVTGSIGTGEDEGLGPGAFLSWLIESTAPEFGPGDAVEWLSGRLPRPVEDEAAWRMDDADDV